MSDKEKRPIVREAVALYDAKTHLSSLVDRAAEGEEIVITKSGKPKARLVPLGDVHPHREPGKGRGQWSVSEDFDAPLPPEVLETFLPAPAPAPAPPADSGQEEVPRA